jgi:hypothetical protein
LSVFPNLTVIDHEPKINKELESLRAKLHGFSTEELDRDLAEIAHEIEFLSEQVKADIDSYASTELERANQKISSFKQRAEILKIELSRRNLS